MPGTEPSSRLPSSTKSTVPSAMCPNPATAVSGTAWAITVPTTLTAAMRGYRNSNATVPSTPAPIEEMVTSAPTTTPVTMVAAGKWRWCNSYTVPSSRSAIFLIQSFSSSTVAVSNNAMLSTLVTRPRKVFSSSARYFSSAMVASAAGRLPRLNSPNTFQSTVPLRLCTQPPTVLVSEAYSRSVPTAVVGETPNTSTSNGVINDPPPTPVTPTISPTRKPDNVYIQSIPASL